MLGMALKKQLKPLVQGMMILVLAQSSVLMAQSAGEEAQDFTLKQLDSDNLRLKELRGQVVLLNFWASWCAPCRKELPLLDDMHKKYEDLGFTVLGVNTDNDPQLAKDVLAKIPVDFPNVLDSDNEVVEQYKVEAMPSTYIIDRLGKVRYVHLGYKEGYEKKYEKNVKTLLRE